MQPAPTSTIGGAETQDVQTAGATDMVDATNGASAVDPQKVAFHAALVQAWSPAGVGAKGASDQQPAGPGGEGGSGCGRSGCAAALGDEEQGRVLPEPSKDGDEKTGAPESAGRRRCAFSRCTRWRCARICFALLAVVSGLAMLFRPRDPEWKISKMDIDAGKFAGVMTGAATSDEPLRFTADVDFHNPNYLGTTTEPGTFKVYLGDDVMATGETNACNVGPRSSSTVRAFVSVSLDEALSAKIMEEVMANDFKLKVAADVETVAKVGFLRVKTYVHCDITSDAMKVLEKPEDVIIEKKCSYSYGL